MRAFLLLVKLFRLIAQSHITFLMRLEEFIRKMRFPLPLFALTLFCTSQKPPQASVKTFLQIKGFFIRNLVFPSFVSHAILQNAH